MTLLDRDEDIIDVRVGHRMRHWQVVRIRLRRRSLGHRTQTRAGSKALPIEGVEMDGDVMNVDADPFGLKGAEDQLPPAAQTLEPNCTT